MRLSSRVKSVSPSLTLAITAKAKKMREQGIDVIGFGSGEPDFDTPVYIKNRAIEAIHKGLTKYTPASGTDSFKRAICEKFLKDNNLRYTPEDIVVSCGAKHSIYNIIQVICEDGDEVVMASPYWLSYPEIVRLAGAKPVFVETAEKAGFKMTPERLRKKIAKKTKALILNSPSNPTGCVYTQDELSKIGEIALENRLLIISDEIYEKIIFDNMRHISIASLGEGLFRNTIVVNGVSKSYAMTGWRIGYAASVDKDIVAAIKNLQSHSTSNPASISQEAAQKAMESESEDLNKMVKEFESRRDYIVNRINKIDGLSCIKPEGAFYVFCRIEKKGLRGMELTRRLLEEANVAVVPGEPFGSDEHIRLSFATDKENIKKGMDRIEEWFKRLCKARP